jgi:hypothetical protein
MSRRAQLIPDADRIEAARLAAEGLGVTLAELIPYVETIVDSGGGVTLYDPDLDPRYKRRLEAAIPDGPANLQLAQGAVGPSFAELDRLAPRAWS